MESVRLNFMLEKDDKNVDGCLECEANLDFIEVESKSLKLSPQ